MPTQNNWEYSPSLEISSAQFVSPLHSIRNKEGQGGHCTFVPQNGMADIPDGQFTFWLYFMQPGIVDLAFRVQDLGAWPLADKYYHLQISSYDGTNAYRYEAPYTAWLGFNEYIPRPGEWDKLQLMWGHSCGFDAKPSFEILLARWTPGGWWYFEPIWDPEDKWRFQPLNRFGFGLRTDEFNAWCYLDSSILQWKTTMPFVP